MELWAGFLLGSGLVIFLVFLILQGGTKELFTSYTRLTTTCPRTYGLRPGSQIKMLDLVIGTAKKLSLADDGKVSVELNINKDYVKFIRQYPNNPDIAKGSVVILKTTGMGIGEAFLEITTGDSSLPVVADNQSLPFVTPPDKIEETITSVKKLVDALNDDRHSLGKLLYDKGAYYEYILGTLKNSQEITAKLDKMLDQITSKEGTVGAFLNDRKFYDNLVHIQEQSKQLLDGLISITKNISVVSNQFSELAKKQDSLYDNVISITKKASELTDNLTPVAKKINEISDQLLVIVKNISLASKDFPNIAERGNQTMAGARDVMDALKRNWFIRPFLAQPSEDDLLEIVPRPNGK
jgi:ABC-type transporter Mla subunit MlaD